MASPRSGPGHDGAGRVEVDQHGRESGSFGRDGEGHGERRFPRTRFACERDGEHGAGSRRGVELVRSRPRPPPVPRHRDSRSSTPERVTTLQVGDRVPTQPWACAPACGGGHGEGAPSAEQCAWVTLSTAPALPRRRMAAAPPDSTGMGRMSPPLPQGPRARVNATMVGSRAWRRLRGSSGWSPAPRYSRTPSRRYLAASSQVCLTGSFPGLRQSSRSGCVRRQGRLARSRTRCRCA